MPLPALGASQAARVSTGVDSFDALLGGGLVPGSSLLVIGQPGAGKSTLLMQLLDSARLPAMYVTGEESLQQLKLRAERLGINSPLISVLFETNVRRIIGHLAACAVKLLVIDSIQTMYTDISGSLPGSAVQIRKCAYLLRRVAQARGLVLLVVGQVTKGKEAAGPKLLEHAVDVVLFLDGEPGGARVLRVSKNRFGPTDSRWVASMAGNGLTFVEVRNESDTHTGSRADKRTARHTAKDAN